MWATYLAGGVGIAIAFSTLGDTPATLDWGCLLAVGVSGILSFVRHSVFHRSDAARMHWDLGVRNNFQIEVGLANLAWGLVAILAVLLDWGLVAQATTFLIFGIYLLGVVGMQVVSPGGKRRSIGPLIAMAAFGMMLVLVGILGMNAA
jgi:hypothetical protein